MLQANLISVALLLVFILICWIMRRKVVRDFSAFLRYIALAVFIGGFVVYFIGYRDGAESIGTQESWFASVFRPILSSLEMFAFNSDVLELGEECKESMVFMTVFSFIHFAAASVSFAVAISYLGVRFKSAWIWQQLKWKKQFKGDVNVFFSINEVSLQLAHDIRRNRPEDIIIFINAPEQATNEGMLGFTSVFNIFSFRREIVAEIDNMGGIILQVKKPIELMEGNHVLEDIGLARQLKKTRAFVGFYMMLDDQLQNIAKSIKLRGDDYFKENMNQLAYIFCRATSGKMNGDTAFDLNSKYGVETVLVDAAQMSVKTMMAQVHTHPVNFVATDPETGMAQSALHCMIIGFGETGQEAFKFIYEHGQFVYPNDFQGKKMIVHIVDPKASQKQGFFEMRYPCLKQGNDMTRLDTEIVWHNHTAGDGRFWELMKEIKDDLNYVVIATGSDNRNIAISYDLCDYALRWRKNRTHDFGIFARCYNPCNETRYDELNEVTQNDRHEQVVWTLGKMSETLTTRYVWKNLLEKKAAIFAYAMNGQSGDDFQTMGDINEEKAFDYYWQRHVSCKGDPARYTDMKRMEYQNYSAATHTYTKSHLLGIDEGRHQEELKTCHTLDDLRKLPYFENLVRGEHLRFLASHECMGYTPMSIQEYEAMGGKSIVDVDAHRLLTMVSFEELDNLPVPDDILAEIPEKEQKHAYRYILEKAVEAALAVGRVE